MKTSTTFLNTLGIVALAIAGCISGYTNGKLAIQLRRAEADIARVRLQSEENFRLLESLVQVLQRNRDRGM
jgi:uncharacterized membrane protein YciS (DUF1049 family)